MFERIKELFKPSSSSMEPNYESIDELPVDDSNDDGDHDASNPENKGETKP